MMNFRRRPHDVPALNTASLPDLIFSVLFFFIIVTHMREETPRVRYRVPEGRELTKNTARSTTVHIYIGSTTAGGAQTHDAAGANPGRMRIQLNDRLVGIDELEDRIAALRNSLPPDDMKRFNVMISADRHADMQTVMAVKQALRRANALRITFAGTQQGGRNLPTSKK